MNRRRFLQTTVGATLLGGSLDLFSAGKPARQAPFRVLYSNDTTNVSGCTSPWHAKGEPFRARHLEASVDEVAGLVDAHFLQPGLGEAREDGERRFVERVLRDGANRMEVTLAAGEAVELAFLDLVAR